MKVVWSFILVTFMVTLFLYLGGVDTVDGGVINTPAGNVSLSTIGVIDGIYTGDVGTLITYVLITIVALMAGIAITNVFTGGNASVGITFAYSIFAIYCGSLAIEYVNLIAKAKEEAGCVGTTILSCGDIGVNIIYIYGVALFIGFIFAIVDLVGGND